MTVAEVQNGMPPRSAKSNDDATPLLREQLQDSLNAEERLRFRCRDLEKEVESLRSVVRHQTEADLIYRSASIIAQLLLTGQAPEGAVQEQRIYSQRLEDLAESEQMRDNLKPSPPPGWEESNAS